MFLDAMRSCGGLGQCHFRARFYIALYCVEPRLGKGVSHNAHPLARPTSWYQNRKARMQLSVARIVLQRTR